MAVMGKRTKWSIWARQLRTVLVRGLGRQIIHVIDHGDEQIEEELATTLHLILHSATALERVACPDDKRKIVGTQLGIVVRRIRIRIPRRRKDGRALDARLQSLLLQRQLLEFLEPVLVCLAIDDGVFQDGADRGLDDGFVGIVGAGAGVFEVPAVALLVVLDAGVVVAFVEVLEDGGEDFGFFVGEVDALVGCLEELARAEGLEPGRVGEDVFVGGEEALFAADGYGDNCTGEVLLARMFEKGQLSGNLTSQATAMSD